ncbi:hypothetical protein ACFV1F_17015 [Streptomyces sp. NPDC059590]|uniref:hypothetical protein n=1 Tax=Streptomyces sp. NPDC059590 TaxID=3346877 RepID=UPI00367D662D
MARRNDDLYAEHASPESIQIQLKKTRAEGRRIQRRITWLEALLERRTAEREAGVWPAAAEDGDTR